MWEKLQQSSVATPVVPEHVALVSGGGFLLLALATSVRIPVAIVGGVLVAAALLVGPSAALGGTTAVVLQDLVRGALGVRTLVFAAWLCVFVGMLAWLSPGVAGGRERAAVHVPQRAVSRFVVAVVVAGIYATASGAWVSTLAKSERFYTVAGDLIPGGLVAGGLGLALLVVAPRLARAVSVADGRLADRPARLTIAGLFVVGTAWMVGAIGVDLLAHDLGLFPTEGQLEYYVAGLLGTGSLVATIGGTVLVAVYRYGETAVLLSAPLAGLLSWAIYTLGRVRVRQSAPDIDPLNGGTEND